MLHNNYFRFFCLMVMLLWGASICASGQIPNTAPVRLRVGTYNVGHFNQGSLGGFQGSGKKATAMLQNWRSWVGRQALDIFGVNEWNTFFGKDSIQNAQQALLNPYYNHIYFGKRNTWIYNGLATNFTLNHIHQVNLDGDYYAIVGELPMNGKIVHVLSVHVPWQKQWHDGSLQKLIDLLKGFEYFICMGDMNSFDDDQLLFTKAGFNMANGGNMGWFPTAGGTSSATGYQGKENVNIDNIVTSADIKIFNVRAPHTGLNDLDHLPILADLVITF